MPPPAYLPFASNSNIVADGCDNDAGGDFDDEEGEPPEIPLFDGVSSTSEKDLLVKFPVVMTVGRSRCRLTAARRVRPSPRFAAMATLFAILVCQSLWPCVAGDPAGDVSQLDGEVATEVPILSAEESPGLRGAIHPDTISEDNKIVSSPSGSCNYECCSSFLDVISQNNGGNDPVEYGQGAIQLESIKSDARMLQESSNTSNPCPAVNEKIEVEGGVGIPAAAQYILIVILVMFSALFSGLTLGLMSLDPSGLEIVMANSDDPGLARAAKAIYPVRLNGNLLLCTLLLGNVGVNSLLSILMADLTSGLVGFIVSTCVIVMFGEIIPQALCSRYALQVGEKTVPMVKVIIVLLYPICKPLSFVLNKVLGHEIGTTYNASEMAKLIEMHVQRGELEGATGAAMKGALQYRGVAVEEVMTPLFNTFMLSADERLGFDTVAKIFKTGYSRIPVYEVSMSNIIGLLFVKDLIFLDPEDEIPVKNFVQIFGRGLHVVWPDDKLGDVLKLLKRGRSHMALVRGVYEGDGEMDRTYEIKGIITLEDIIEIILGDEIVDETDELVDVNDPGSIVQRSEIGEYIEGAMEGGGGSPLVGGGASDRGCTRATDWEARLRLLDERLVDEHLSSDEVRAVAAHLKTNYSRAVELISDRQLKEVLSLVPVTEIAPASTCATEDGGDGSGVPTDSSELIYERGVPAEFCTVVLSGKIMVMSGADKFRSDVSNWGVLASRALTDTSYVPDFSAWVVPNQNSSGGCRCVKIDRKSYYNAVDNTALEKTDLKVDPPRATGVAMSAIITNGSPTILNESTARKGGSNSSSPDDPAQKGAVRAKQNGQPSKPRSYSLPPQIPDNAVHAEHSGPSYVRTDVQRNTHSRRSKLLKAFSRATRDEQKE